MRSRLFIHAVAVGLALGFGRLSAWPASGTPEPVGGLRGVVRDADLGGTVPAAAALLVERNARALSGDDGSFFFAGLPPGVYTLRVTKPGYEAALSADIAVPPGQVAEVVVELRAEVTDMEEMVVRDIEVRDTGSEAGLLNIREASVTMQDAISGELLRRAGAGDAAGALKLVVGASVEDGKYATVRGLSDRYVGASLNRIRIPSADPHRRAVHMDLFPAGTIKSISVSKTYTPDLPGDFTGGGVNIETVGIPDKPFLRLSFSRESDPQVTGRTDFLSYEGSRVDRWARHRGARDMPEGAATMEEDGLASPMPSEHQYPVSVERPHSEKHRAFDRLTRDFDPAIGVSRRRAGPNWGAGMGVGDRGVIGDGVWGWVAALTYSDKHQMARGTDTHYLQVSPASPKVDPEKWDQEIGAREVKYSQTAAAGVGDGGEQEISVMGLRNRVATDRASIRRQFLSDAPESDFWVSQALHYTERALDALQFRGRHEWIRPEEALFGLKADWHAARHITEQEEPDVRFFRNFVMRQPDGTWLHQPRPPGAAGADQDSSTRIWRNTLERNTQLGLNAELPFERGAADPQGRFHGPERENPRATGRMKFGISRDWTVRTYRQNSFFYVFPGQMAPLYTGPVRDDYPAGRAGRLAFNAARDAWMAGPEGRLYNQLIAAAAQDLLLGSHRTDTSDRLWSEAFLDPDRIGSGPWQNSMYWHIQPRAYDVEYDGYQNLSAGYAMIEMPATRQLTILFGSRAENTDMRVIPRSDRETFNPEIAYLVPVRNPVTNVLTGVETYYYTIRGVPREEAEARIQDSRWLPSAGLVYELAPGMKLRGSWSRTIARPTFLEIAPIITYDYIGGDTFIGNNDLQITEAVNYDARWEWMRTDGEVYALSWFRKELTHPIEKESFAYLTHDYLLAVNYPSGRVGGIEAEFRRRLDFLPWPGEHLTLNLNYTRMQARVTLPEQARRSFEIYGYDRETRGMEGQPKYLFNVGLMADFDRWGLAAGLFYNLRGDTLKSGAAIGEGGVTPDVYTLEQGTLNFTMSKKIGPHLTVGFRLANLTEEAGDEVYRVPGRPDMERRKYPAGVKTSFSVSGSF